MKYSQDNEDCSICLEKIKIQDKCSLIPCKHNFCYNCIRGWFQHGQTCPYDRTVTTYIKFLDPQSSDLMKLPFNEFINYDDKMKMYKLIKETKDFINFLIENIETQCKSINEFIVKFISKQFKMKLKYLHKSDIDKISSDWRSEYFEVVNYQYLWSEINDQYIDILDRINEFLQSSWDLRFSIEELRDLKETMISLFKTSKMNKIDIENVYINWKVEDIFQQNKKEMKMFHHYVENCLVNKNKDIRMPDKIYSIIDSTSFSISTLLRANLIKYHSKSNREYLKDVKEKCYSYTDNIKRIIIN